MMNMLEEAIIYATVMHQGKVRKFGNRPFILHPLEVAQILSTMTDDQEIITAGMKDANGFCVDVARVESLPKDMTTMRMNVRDFEEAYEFLKARGFVNPRGDHIVESPSAKSCLLISPSGFSIQLTQHIRNHD